MEPFVSVVIPTKNCEGLIGNCLRSLQEMDYPKDRMEIIVSDGLSTDKTIEIAESYGAKVVLDHGKSIVSGRNAGFSVAEGELIAISDADCVMDKGWLRNSFKYFEDPKVGGVGGPNLVPEDETAFGKAVGLVFAYAPYVTKAAHTRVLNKVIKSRSHGSNAIYRASVLRKVTPVDESLIHGEDVIMNDEIEELGYELLYVPDVRVKHYRRPTPRSWWNQMFTYGKARVIVPRKRRQEMHLMHILAGVSVPVLSLLLAICAVISFLITPWLLVGLAGVLLFLALFSSAFAIVSMKSVKVGLNMPLVLAIFFVAWSFGFMREFFFPTKHMKRSEATNESSNACATFR